MLDVILSKKESIERCLVQIKQHYATMAEPEDELETNYLIQDAIALNLQRACELAIDLANFVVRKKRLGLPKESKDSFILLAKNGIITPELCKKCEGMIGFRNILVHEYQHIDLEIMHAVIKSDLSDLIDFCDTVLKIFKEE